MSQRALVLLLKLFNRFIGDCTVDESSQKFFLDGTLNRSFLIPES